MSLLAFEGVALARGGRVLVKGVSFALEPGAVLVIMGPNGAGKSSLLRVAAGLLMPIAGTVRREGTMALLGEAAALDGERTVRDALAFWARLDGAGGDAVDSALATLDLLPLAELPVRMLSTGQRRRAAMARVVASGAGLWLLDEPANGLDAAAVARLEEVIARHRDGGGAVMVATHLALDVPGAQHLLLSTPPGEGRDPVAMPSDAEDGTRTRSSSRLGPGLRRGGKASE